MPIMKDPAFLPKIETLFRSVTVTDPSAPGDSWEFTFGVTPGLPENIFLTEKKEQLIKAYVHDRGFIPVDGVEVKVSEKLCGYLALLLTHDRTVYMAKSQEGFDLPTNPWGIFHWVAFAQKCPNAFADALSFLSDLQAEAMGGTPGELEQKKMEDEAAGRVPGDPLGNASAAGGASS